MKTCVLTALLCVGIALSATMFAAQREDVTVVPFVVTTLSVSHGASGSGVVSPGCAARITGGRFAVEGFQAMKWPLPTTLGGVTVKVGGVEAALYYVDDDEIQLIVPDIPRKSGLTWGSVALLSSEAPDRWWRQHALLSFSDLDYLSAAQKSLVRWYRVDVTSSLGSFTGWMAITPTAPGFYQQADGDMVIPQGVYVTDGIAPRLLTAQSIENNGTVLMLNGSGFRRAQTVTAFISDEADGYWAVPAVAGRNGLFEWRDIVTIPIPPEAHGRLTITAQADAMTSNQVFVNVQ